MDFKDEKSRMLFLRYALPCADTLVKRGAVKANVVRDAIEDVSLGERIRGKPERVFKTAIKMCGNIARRSKKSLIDEKVIRQYFLFEHDDVIDQRYKMFKDFSPIRCRTYSGRFDGKLVKTIVGARKYKTCFVPSLKRGDYVVVHRNFIAEIIGKPLHSRLWKSKQKYFNS